MNGDAQAGNRVTAVNQEAFSPLSPSSAFEPADRSTACAVGPMGLSGPSLVPLLLVRSLLCVCVRCSVEEGQMFTAKEGLTCLSWMQ